MDDYCRMRALLAAILTAGVNANPVCNCEDDTAVNCCLAQADLILEQCGFAQSGLTVPE